MTPTLAHSQNRTTRQGLWLVAACLSLAVAISFSACLVACAVSAPAVYARDGLSCVDKADSAVSARACINALDEREFADGGRPWGQP